MWLIRIYIVIIMVSGGGNVLCHRGHICEYTHIDLCYVIASTCKFTYRDMWYVISIICEYTNRDMFSGKRYYIVLFELLSQDDTNCRSVIGLEFCSLF